MTPFDSWSAIHLLSWALICIILRLGILNSLYIALVGGICWEAVEPYFGIQEVWVNSFVTDVVANCLGGILGGYIYNKSR